VKFLARLSARVGNASVFQTIHLRSIHLPLFHHFVVKKMSNDDELHNEAIESVCIYFQDALQLVADNQHHVGKRGGVLDLPGAVFCPS
jgi:hypothetical protein